MKPLEEALKLDPEKMLDEVQERRTLIDQMIGQLYPRILNSEIEELLQEYNRRHFATK